MYMLSFTVNRDIRGARYQMTHLDAIYYGHKFLCYIELDL